ncbi:MAG: KH domain-containing protein [Bacilli bacterium]|nr:KH domain-containing protein [Bacilli bacterium]
MLEIIRLETKNKEEAISKFLNENDLTIEDIYIKETEEEGSLFKSKKYILEIIKKSSIIEYIKNYFKELSEKMNIEIKSEVRLLNDCYKITLVTEQNSIIIGKDGKNLDAIQTLLTHSLSKRTKMRLRINVDASNYRASKQKNFEYEIKKIAKDVLRTKMEIKLDPMNSYNRRLVHSIVGEFGNLTSESYGESPDRYVVIKYKED